MIKIKTYLRSKTDEGLNDYIESLENYFKELNASNTNQLIFKLDELNGSISEDVQKIIDGEAIEWVDIETRDRDTGEIKTVSSPRSTLKILNDDRDSKVFDRVMTLYGKLKDLKAVSDYVSSLVPEIEDEDMSGIANVKFEKNKNPFESISQQVIKGK